MRRGAWIIGLWVVVLAPARAHAQAALPLELEWKAPVECAQAADVRAELERIARVRPDVELTRLRVRGEVIRSDGYAVLLYTERNGTEGERQLHAADCATLVRSVTLVLALAFGAGVEIVAEPNAQAGSGAHAPPAAQADAGTPVPSSKQAEAHAETQAQPSAQAQREPVQLSLALLLGGGAQFGLLPSPGLSILAGTELVYGALSVQLRATALAPVETEVPPDAHARFDGLAGSLLGCGNLPRAAVVPALCGGARVGALRGRSSGVSEAGSATAPWFALVTAASLSWPRAARVRVRLEAALSLSPGRPRFEIAGLGEAHHVPRLIGELTLLVVLAP